MNTTTSSGLDRIFELQDQVLQQRLASSQLVRDAYLFLSDCILLNGQILDSMKFAHAKQKSVRYLASDTISHTIVATRVALWGDLPESLTMVRSACESSAQLLFIVGGRKYETALYEMDRKFNQVSFENAISALGHFGKSIGEIHGRISDIAAHSTANRLKHNVYEKDGEIYLRLGFTRDLDNAACTVFYCMHTCMWVMEAFHEAYEQDGVEFKWAVEVNALKRRFAELKQKFQEYFSALK